MNERVATTSPETTSPEQRFIDTHDLIAIDEGRGIVRVTQAETFYQDTYLVASGHVTPGTIPFEDNTRIIIADSLNDRGQIIDILRVPTRRTLGELYVYSMDRLATAPGRLTSVEAAYPRVVGGEVLTCHADDTLEIPMPEGGYIRVGWIDPEFAPNRLSEKGMGVLRSGNVDTAQFAQFTLAKRVSQGIRQSTRAGLSAAA